MKCDCMYIGRLDVIRLSVRMYVYPYSAIAKYIVSFHACT